MQLESHATPIGVTPQQRYASLHRAIEQGLDSDEVWRDLAEVSATLGHAKEAERCVTHIRHAGMRHAVEQRVALINGSQRTEAGSRREAAPREGAAVERDPRHAHPGVAEHLLDAFQYVLHQHMPWLVLTTTLAFPLVIGVGGFLTAGGSILLLAAIAALPGLSVLAVVAAMARQILLTSSEGVSDVPNIPEFGHLVRAARSCATDAATTLALFFTAPALLFALDAPVMATAGTFLLGALFAPLAFALRQIRGDMAAFTPRVLFSALRRCGRGYPVLAAACTLLFAPAVAMLFAVHARPVWVQVAVVGPLGVVPAFVVCRMLGSWLDTRRDALGDLLHGPMRQLAASPAEPEPEAPQPAQPRTPRRPEALNRFRAPNVQAKAPHARRAQAPASALTRRRAPAAEAEGKSPRAIEGRRPTSTKPSTPAPRATSARPQQAPASRPDAAKQPQPAAANAAQGAKPSPAPAPAPRAGKPRVAAGTRTR